MAHSYTSTGELECESCGTADDVAKRNTCPYTGRRATAPCHLDALCPACYAEAKQTAQWTHDECRTRTMPMPTTSITYDANKAYPHRIACTCGEPFRGYMSRDAALNIADHHRKTVHQGRGAVTYPDANAPRGVVYYAPNNQPTIGHRQIAR